MFPEVSLVVPVLNESDAIPIFYAEVKRQLPPHVESLEIVFVDDGSTDGTYQILTQIAAKDDAVRVVRLTRNFGKEAALMAGLEHATGRCVIPLDVDLQDPIDVIPRLLEKWRSGFEIVLAVREDRSSDSALKRESARLFYRFHNRISNPKIAENVGDFRLLDRSMVDNIKQLGERNLFMKGILGWVGGRTAIVPYRRAPRSAGTSKFNGWKLWNFAVEGITSFSTVPLRIWTYLGLFVAGISLIYAFIMVIEKLLWGNPVPGYPSLMTAVLFLGGIQLIGIGVLGEYIGRIYIETKGRPRYLVQRESENDA